MRAVGRERREESESDARGGPIAKIDAKRVATRSGVNVDALHPREMRRETPEDVYLSLR